MTATLHRPKTTAATAPRPSGAPAPKPRTSRINHTRAGVGLLVTLVSVMAVVALYLSADDRSPAVALARAVPAGQPLVADDLTTIDMPTDSAVPVVPAAQVGDLIGQVALVPLSAGALLAPSQVADQPSVPAGSAVIGATMKPGQFPVGLQVGDEVQVVETPPQNSSTASAPVDHGRARVTDIAEGEAGTSGLTVSLLVDNGKVVTLASAGAAGRLAVAVVGS